jgi:hypothetical protein
MQRKLCYAALGLTLTLSMSVQAEITKGVMFIRGAEMP